MCLNSGVIGERGLGRDKARILYPEDRRSPLLNEITNLATAQ